MSGRFIVFEGGEGSGKSTQAALLAAKWGALLTREPGGTAVGAKIRELLLEPSTGELDPRAEALLMAADRSQHVNEVIRPTLAAGRDVVCDRYAYSSIAYQGYGRELDVGEIERLSGWASADLWPEVVVLLDIDAEVATARLQRELDRFERAGEGFHERVRAGFRALAAADPTRWVVVDGSAPVESVRDEIDARLETRWDAPTRHGEVTSP